MTASTIEQRISVIENELAEIKARLAPAVAHPWDAVFGALADSEGFEEAVRLGRNYRESLRPKTDEGSAY